MVSPLDPPLYEASMENTGARGLCSLSSPTRSIADDSGRLLGGMGDEPVDMSILLRYSPVDPPSYEAEQTSKLSPWLIADDARRRTSALQAGAF